MNQERIADEKELKKLRQAMNIDKDL